MDFKEATDMLFRTVSHAELAERIGCSVATIRQARMGPDTRGHRAPPPGWERAVAELAKERGTALGGLADRLRSSK